MNAPPHPARQSENGIRMTIQDGPVYVDGPPLAESNYVTRDVLGDALFPAASPAPSWQEQNA